jgi:hypothetical protein
VCRTEEEILVIFGYKYENQGDVNEVKALRRVLTPVEGRFHNFYVLINGCVICMLPQRDVTMNCIFANGKTEISYETLNVCKDFTNCEDLNSLSLQL